MADKEVAELLVGPHLIGLIFIIAASIQKKWQPKKINSLYGYRTPASMKNQQTWDEANRYSANLMLKLGMILVVTGVVSALGLHYVHMSESIFAAVTLMLILAGSIGSVIVLLTSTERHLEKNFGNKKDGPEQEGH